MPKRRKRFVWACIPGTPVQWPVEKRGEEMGKLVVYVKSDNAMEDVPADEEVFNDCVSDSEADMEEDCEPKKTVAKKTKTKRQRWDREEEEEIRKYFQSYLDMKITPRTQAVQKAKEKSKLNNGKIWMRSADKIIKKISATNHKV